MILALLLGAGVVVLLIAPTLHRRSVANSRAGLAGARDRRVSELRSGPDGIEFELAGKDALRVRDSLLLRGVRTEVVRSTAGATLVGHSSDRAAIMAAIDELVDPDTPPANEG
jgi:hypothetical protein